MSIVTQISKKGQILVPSLLRGRSGLKPGFKVQLLETAQGILLKPAPQDPIAAACGFLKGGPSLTQALIRQRRRDKQREESLVRKYRPR